MEHKIIIFDGTPEESGLDDDIEPEYDLDQMEVDIERTRKFRAAALTRLRAVTLDPDIFAFFKTPEAVNEALRRVMNEMRGGA
jgi:hypothetical protein